LSDTASTARARKAGHLRDEVTRVHVEFLIAGEYPGDRKAKSVRFPTPGDVAETSADGLRFVNLKTLIELKSASARSAPHRIRDRADVLELIHLLSLPRDFADPLDPYVRQDFRDLAATPPSEQDWILANLKTTPPAVQCLELY
jgi:hypothetical protein